MQQIVSNLISNAIRHAEKKVEVHLYLCQEEFEVRIAVKDDGPGLYDVNSLPTFAMFGKME